MRRVGELVLAVCVTGAVAVAGAQAPGFEVATIKANKSGDTREALRRQPGGRMTAINIPLRPLITYAYQLAQYQLVGGPGWLATDRFDIVAKLEGDPPAGPPGAGADPVQLALRTLLADRFKLKVHRETREMDIYALVMVKPGTPGPRLAPSTTDCAAQAAAARRSSQPQPFGGAPGMGFCGVQSTEGRLRFGGRPASTIVSALAGQAGRMVVDRTGLTGNWDFEVTFAPDDARASDAPSFFTAIQEQLGLKLESTKGPVEVLVVDSAEHPTDD